MRVCSKLLGLSLPLFALLIHGCFGAKEDPGAADLDVAMEKSPAVPGESTVLQDEIVERSGGVIGQSEKTSQAAAAEVAAPNATADHKELKGPTANDVLKWRGFFQPLPNVQEREVIASTLKQWSGVQEPKVLLEKGRKEVAIGRYNDAESSFRQILRKEPQHPEALLELAQIYLRQDAVDRCMAVLSDLREISNFAKRMDRTFLLRYRYILANAYLAAGNRKKAHDTLTDLIRIAPNFAPAYVALASSYLALGRDDAALFVTKSGMDRTVIVAAYYNTLGIIERRQGRYEGASEYFQEALKVDSAFAPALANLGVLQADMFEFELAEHSLLRASGLDPTNVDTLIALSIVRRHQGKTTAALETLKRAMELAPENPQVRFNLAVMTADDLKDHEVALRLFREAFQIAEPASPLREQSARYISALEASRGSP